MILFLNLMLEILIFRFMCQVRKFMFDFFLFYFLKDCEGFLKVVIGLLNC